MKKVDWAKFVNNLNVEFPEIGDDAPEEEMISKSEDLADTVGTLTRLTLDIFIFDNDELEQAYMMQNDKMKIYSDITLRDAVAMANKKKNKKA